MRDCTSCGGCGGSCGSGCGGCAKSLSLTPEEIALTTGVFADRDELVDCREEFEGIYPGRAHIFPGGHFPNFNQIKQHIFPIIGQTIKE